MRFLRRLLTPKPAKPHVHDYRWRRSAKYLKCVVPGCTKRVRNVLRREQ